MTLLKKEVHPCSFYFKLLFSIPSFLVVIKTKKEIIKIKTYLGRSPFTIINSVGLTAFDPHYFF